MYLYQVLKDPWLFKKKSIWLSDILTLPKKCYLGVLNFRHFLKSFMCKSIDNFHLILILLIEVHHLWINIINCYILAGIPPPLNPFSSNCPYPVLMGGGIIYELLLISGVWHSALTAKNKTNIKILVLLRKSWVLLQNICFWRRNNQHFHNYHI